MGRTYPTMAHVAWVYTLAIVALGMLACIWVILLIIEGWVT